MSGHPVRWAIAVQAVREYNMQFGMSYEEANKKAEAEVSTYKPAEKQ